MNVYFTAQNKLAGNTLGISDELISLEIVSPDICDLTLIDLPGITRVPMHGQPDDIADQVSIYSVQKSKRLFENVNILTFA